MNVVKINGDRFYEIDSRRYPSVTTVLSVIRKPELEQWRGRVGNEEADSHTAKAANRGTHIHDYLCQFAQGLPINDAPEDVRPILRSFSDWRDARVEKNLGSEVTLLEPLFGFAGTADSLDLFKGHDLPTVVDYKTGGSHETDWALQLHAYRMALRYAGIETDGGLVLQMMKDGTWIEHHFPPDPRVEYGFLSALSLWKFLRNWSDAA